MNVYIPSTGFATQGPCPDGFHVPLITEWQGLKTIMDGLGLTTGDNWRINLHIPFAGYRSSSIYYQGSLGYYWSSSPYGSNKPDRAIYLYLRSSDVNATGLGSRRADGYSVRCFKNSFEVPTSSWTVINGTLGGAGIFRDTVNGLISITGDGSTGYTIQDKNLGATTAYSDGDTLSEANCGKYYQWGNNYGFAWTGSVTTSSTQVDASSYGPGNYYSSSTFITGNNDWSSVHNDNLRGGEDGNVNITTMNELKNAYIGEYIPPYLCFTANTAGSTVQLTKTGSPTAVTLETSTDGSNWSTYTFGNTITLSNIGDKVFFRNKSTTDTGFSTSTSNYYQFVMTGSITSSGDVNYLLNKNSTNTVSDYCYYRLFYQCTSLTTAPSLPAPTLATHCYNGMFRGCTGLTAAPSLSATTLAQYCYYTMFYGCTSLANAPVLPASTAARYCYYYMFRQCTSLKIAPALPATTLNIECYYGMFFDCSNLEELPKLPATTLDTECYAYMFYGCSKIKLSTTQTGAYQTAYRIPTTGTGTTATDALYYMFYNTGGTFTSNPSINTTYYTSNTVV